MDTYKVKQKFHYRLQPMLPGDEIVLGPLEGRKFKYLGWVEGPIERPKQSRKRRSKQHGDATD